MCNVAHVSLHASKGRLGHTSDGEAAATVM
jgi:hypothetical protein